MKNNYTDYKLQQSEAIQRQFDFIKMHFGFQILDDKEREFFNNIPIFFYDNPHSIYVANAYKRERDISYNLGTSYTARFTRTLIHEIAHLICYEYFSEKMGHTLEFAIVNYCLLHKYKSDYSSFFESYDIQEDECYKWISICPAQFDDFIKSIKWDTLKELTKRAKFLAMKIRAKQAFFTITTWEKEYAEFERTNETT